MEELSFVLCWSKNKKMNCEKLCVCVQIKKKKRNKISRYGSKNQYSNVKALGGPNATPV